MLFNVLSTVFSHFFCVILGIGGQQNFPPPLSAKEENELFLKKKEGDHGDQLKFGRRIGHGGGNA